MPLPSTKSENKRQFWQRHISDWKSSNLNRTQYCAEHGLNKHTLDYWRKKLACLQPSLLPVTIIEEPPGSEANRSCGIVLKTECNLTIELSKDFDAGTLKRLVGVLSECS